MAAEAARVLEYMEADFSGTAAPVLEPYSEPIPIPMDMPAPQEEAAPRQRKKEEAARSEPTVSMFAVFGAVFAGVLMIFVMLAQINYNDVASEVLRLNRQLGELAEVERRLEIEFENVIDMKEIERYARDSLGMSRPDVDQVAVIRTIPVDSAEIIRTGGESSALSGLTSFISSLLEYTR